ncbi:phenylacetate-CoA oxygenase subunit PaaJ [Paenibacillus melissococcoides]|uniref:Phenylacetate-CoA oxygenase subunit PaaJ n=1 Tax=Paenibacillus melissococcoides TaxID=2912268 RepID=A0ABM9G7H3_9BACL|nr:MULTISPECIES: 1,2-phenylacetyl-CoA epoxidase subunit PaaD [Paenibacillus]MEB9897427.1 phenylacetate-CoA oxygenase subunit PaaJ [Bacillus cereus]CAH8247866.1 phenylacetate-CoA oxygenase subunit PaaJ [Paenibacillus melissococcoides]CAH8719309.1 phenylacetate-CoA oxygenase subunit PaaJ [Paenibacillus melissococcoides]CAH8720320.1 phenylacetate-CoA oxygenase subunit PaaJ [Paenibacillus melissococcoides]GIO78848.1 phenylacetic acid degradation protein [Paenibacillus dendritiformis]
MTQHTRQLPTGLEERIWTLLQEVKDPEIPVISMSEMGMIHRVVIGEGAVEVEVLPTFIGCPALEMMKSEIQEKLLSIEGVREANVRFLQEPAWTSDRISDEGREKLRSFGIVAPPRGCTPGEEWEVRCPYCNSPYTRMDNMFGPAACRSILYCKHCKNPFEALKVL